MAGLDIREIAYNELNAKNGRTKQMIELRKKDPDFHGVKLCVQALNLKASGITSLQVLHVKSGVVTATDSHKLCQYALQNSLDDGFYKVLKSNMNLIQLELCEHPYKYSNLELIEGMISKAHKDKTVIDRKALVHGLRQMAILKDQCYNGLKMVFSVDSLRLEIVNPDLGFAETDLKATYGGKGLTIGINVNYLLGILKSMKSETVEMYTTNAESPVLIEGREDIGCIAVIMPMRI